MCLALNVEYLALALALHSRMLGLVLGLEWLVLGWPLLASEISNLTVSCSDLILAGAWRLHPYRVLFSVFNAVSGSLVSYWQMLILKVLYHQFITGCHPIFYHSILLKLNFCSLTCLNNLPNSIVLQYLCLIVSHCLPSARNLGVIFFIQICHSLNTSLPFLNLVFITFVISNVSEALLIKLLLASLPLHLFILNLTTVIRFNSIFLHPILIALNWF